MKIKGLILDLRKEENAPYATTLGLKAYIQELETEAAYNLRKGTSADKKPTDKPDENPDIL